jgi:regulator of replication initiation timing
MGLGGEEGQKTALEEIREDIVALGEKDTELQGEIDALEERLDVEGGLVDRLEAVEAFKQGHSHEGLQGEIDAAEGRIDTLEAFVQAHSHEAMEQGIAANKAAIEKEVEDRDAAIEEALKVYSTTEEMKTVIGNVVNSLALTMENDKVVLKLGGVDGIALTSVDLDMATDADIDAIIAGLDAE